MSDWKKSGTIKVQRKDITKYSHLVKYDKLAIKYGVSIALLVRTDSESEYSFVSQTLASVSTGGVNTIGIGARLDEGLLVDPPSHMRVKKEKTENEMKSISDKLRKSILDFEDDLIDIAQIPISVTRKKAKIRNSDKPYDVQQ